MHFSFTCFNPNNQFIDEETEDVVNTPTTDYSVNPYCFRFTWLGPRYNNESVYLNATCADVVRGATNVPCLMPLVVSGVNQLNLLMNVF